MPAAFLQDLRLFQEHLPPQQEQHLLPQQALMLPQYLILQQLGLLDTLAGLLLVTAFQPWMVLLFWFGASRLDGELFDAAACDGAAGATFARRLAWAARICSSRPRARSIGW